MVETLQSPTSSSNDEAIRRDSNGAIFDIQRNIFRKRGFTNFDGKFHISTLLQPAEIISAMRIVKQLVINNDPISTGIIINAERIIDRGWPSLWGFDDDSIAERVDANGVLLALTEMVIEGGMGKNKLQSLEGIRLSALSVVAPEEYARIEKSANQRCRR